ncbi:dihydroxyacetone kinase subunit DhaK [Quadrisphaera sp. INWT6]|uniref:dihydroxyacetone kinase subunit DhaK n=1 Tax=Quadrisphaera sp. INWT6 TaxID=2596917 RepID=UPI0019D5CCDA|nr:dihydroxyacetone kinase subunit DhaK [Quadrisphaera sp. INWT6]
MADDVHPSPAAETHFLPDPASAVADAARGLAMAHPADVGVVLDPLHLHALRRAPGRRVALVSGGGAGHEPMHAGFLGPGGLDAACPGLVFTSPHHRQVHAAARRVAGPGGVLLVVKNYTGDVICFAIAAERLRAEGVQVETVLVDDDLASDPDRRGTAATVLVEKVLGAAADRGDDLAALAALGREVVARSRSLAVASRAQTSPATGEPAFSLAPGELERGVGIHGERAASTTSRPPTRGLVAGMLDELLAGLEDAGAPGGDDGVALLVNGLGGATSLELHALRALVGDQLAERGVRVATSLVGTFTAALDMRGFSLTLLSLRPGWLELLTAPTATPSLPSLPGDLAPQVEPGSAAGSEDGGAGAGQDPDDAGAAVLDAWTRACEGVVDELTRLDQLAGDGDFGANLTSGLGRSQRRGGTLAGAAGAFLDEVGGSSGPLLGLLLGELAPAVRRGAPAEEVGAALRRGAQAVTRVGGAEVGDRTFLDALVPAAEALLAGGSLDGAARAAADGARSSAQLVGRRGRSRYLGDRALGAPDPGAVAVALLVVALAQVLAPGGELPEASTIIGG